MNLGWSASYSEEDQGLAFGEFQALSNLTGKGTQGLGLANLFNRMKERRESCLRREREAHFSHHLCNPKRPSESHRSTFHWGGAWVFLSTRSTKSNLFYRAALMNLINERLDFLLSKPGETPVGPSGGEHEQSCTWPAGVLSISLNMMVHSW